MGIGLSGIRGQISGIRNASLRAKRSNPENMRNGKIAGLLRSARNDAGGASRRKVLFPDGASLVQATLAIRIYRTISSNIFRKVKVKTPPHKRKYILSFRGLSNKM